MSETGLKELKKALKEQGKKINQSKEGARKFLKESGAMTKGGAFKKGFKPSK